MKYDIYKWLTQNKAERWPAVRVTKEHSKPHEWVNKNPISKQRNTGAIIPKWLKIFYMQKHRIASTATTHAQYYTHTYTYRSILIINLVDKTCPQLVWYTVILYFVITRESFLYFQPQYLSDILHSYQPLCCSVHRLKTCWLYLVAELCLAVVDFRLLYLKCGAVYHKNFQTVKL